MFLSPERHIAHFDLDSFFVSVEQLKNPKLKNRPLIVGGTGDRGVVAACSYEARKFGVHSAMPIRLARRLCPEALVIRGDYEAYGKFSTLVTEVIKDSVPLFEKSSIVSPSTSSGLIRYTTLMSKVVYTRCNPLLAA